jgi:predicted mannosyl-3-phosphoglycerate phosphatase (HAD superfamily)
MLHTVLAGRLEPMARPWMVVLADARVLGESHARAPSQSDPAVKTLVSHGVPVILLSCDRAERVRAVQSALGIRAPFISAGGTELHVPVGYFDEILGLRQPSDDWNVIGFQADGDAPGFSQAIQLLLLLYWSRRDDGLVVGVSDRERAILSQADVPILVRNANIDQAPLRAHMPDAYFTSATGSAGWAEAILGSIDT